MPTTTPSSLTFAQGDEAVVESVATGVAQARQVTLQVREEPSTPPLPPPTFVKKRRRNPYPLRRGMLRVPSTFSAAWTLQQLASTELCASPCTLPR